ncbi:MAG: hypothetical protein V4662_22180 [Verrucomicrobiota bacterium]
MQYQHILSALVAGLFLAAAPCLIAQDAGHRLEPLKPALPALIGYLGEPDLGVYGFGTSNPVWLENGTIYAAQFQGDSVNLCRWHMDAATRRVRLKDVLNVGGNAWCVSRRGDLVCAQFQSQQRRDRLVTKPDHLGLFRADDGTCLWKLPVGPEEHFLRCTFTSDESHVALLSWREQRLSLRLIDTQKGVVIRRHDFDGVDETGRAQLVARSSSLWVRRADGRVFRLPIETLVPEDVQCPAPSSGGLEVSADEQTISITSGGSCTILHRKGGDWEVVFEDSTFETPGGYPEGFMGVSFHPDSKQAVISQAVRLRLIDLASKKVVSEIAAEFWHGASFSPEGHSLLTGERPGFGIRSGTTLKPQSQTTLHQHRHAAGPLLALPGGRTLASADHEGIWLWDLAARKPIAHLRSRTHEAGALRSMALVDNGHAIIADDWQNFLAWQLPPLEPLKAGQEPPEIPFSPAFGSLVEDGQELPTGKVFASANGKVIVTRTAGREEFTLRTGLGARTSTAFPGPITKMHLQQGVVTDDGQTFVYGHPLNQEYLKVDLPSGQTSKFKDPVIGSATSADGSPRKARHYRFWGLLPDARRFIGFSGTNFCVMNLDGKSGLVEMDDLPKNLDASSEDTRMPLSSSALAVRLYNLGTQEKYISIWDLGTGKLRALQVIPFDDVQALTMSPDGQTLLCSHTHGAISLWDVSKMSAVLPAPEASKETPPPATAQAGSQPVLPRSPNNRSDRYGEGLWLFSEAGTASKGAHLPEIGRLRVGGNDFAHQGWQLTNSYWLGRYFTAQRDFQTETVSGTKWNSARVLQPPVHGKIGAGLISAGEGIASSVWVSRQIGNPTAYNEPFLIFTDTLHNQDLETSRKEIEFEVRFPEASGRLIDSSFKPVKVSPNGRADVDPDAIWVAPIMKEGSTDPIPALIFRSRSSTRMPRIDWVAAENRLVVRHDVELPAAEPRHLVHAIIMIQRAPGSSPEHFNPPRWVDFSLALPYSENLRGLNFAVLPTGPLDGFDMPVGLMSPEGSRGRFIPKDTLGFPWVQNRDGSFHGQLGASSVLQLRIADIPLCFAGSHLFTMIDGNKNESRQPDVVEYFGEDLDQKLQVARGCVPKFSKEPLSLMYDRFFNRSKEPVTKQVSYVSTFSEPVKQIFAANGQPLAAGAELSLDKTQGALVFEVPGEDRPATLVAFHEQGAALAPKLSMPTPKMLKIDYEITIPPLQSVVLWHGTTQRPLASFASVEEAFTGCLPLKRRRPEEPLLNGSNVK